LAAAALSAGGCTSVGEYVRNGFKVGPNYSPPGASVAEHWIDEADRRVRTDSDPPARWWTVFNDDVLNGLIERAASQNLTLREAGFRILAARAQLGIARGNFFPQQQDAKGVYARIARPGTIISTKGFPTLPPPFAWPPYLDFANFYLEQWNFDFNLFWELDFWGRFRRATAAADATLDASVAGYDGVLVTLLADVASNYVQVRTLQKRIELLRANVKLQQVIVNAARERFNKGATDEVDASQTGSILAQTEAQIPQSQIALRQACTRLCILMGVPPSDLERQLGEGPIPVAPPEVVVGIPADLLRRRPDVRRAERLLAAQAERIGIAEADFYPAIGLHGTLGWQANSFPEFFSSSAFNSSVGPALQWDLLNYGRILNNVRLQNAEFEALAASYQNTVLRANGEAEDAIVTFLRAQEVAKALDRSVANAQKAESIVGKYYQEGDKRGDVSRLALIQQNLVQQQDLQTQAYGEIAQGLIQVYRALGGGWEFPVSPEPSEEAPAVAPSTQLQPSGNLTE
jgi:NodT family efflux transporter outer membrane factor (OMF) lipoprotein